MTAGALGTTTAYGERRGTGRGALSQPPDNVSAPGTRATGIRVEGHFYRPSVSLPSAPLFVFAGRGQCFPLRPL